MEPIGTVQDRAVPQETTIIEASSGNPPIALAQYCAIKRYRLTICMSEIQSMERRKILLALGLKVSDKDRVFGELMASSNVQGASAATPRALEPEVLS